MSKPMSDADKVRLRALYDAKPKVRRAMTQEEKNAYQREWHLRKGKVKKPYGPRKPKRKPGSRELQREVEAQSKAKPAQTATMEEIAHLRELWD